MKYKENYRWGRLVGVLHKIGATVFAMAAVKAVFEGSWSGAGGAALLALLFFSVGQGILDGQRYGAVLFLIECVIYSAIRVFGPIPYSGAEATGFVIGNILLVVINLIYFGRRWDALY